MIEIQFREISVCMYEKSDHVFSQVAPVPHMHSISTQQVLQSVEENGKDLSTFSVQLQLIFQDAEDSKNYKLPL